MNKPAMYRLTMKPDLGRPDDEVMPEIVNALKEQHPGVVEGWQYEREGDDILLMLWGDIHDEVNR